MAPTMLTIQAAQPGDLEPLLAMQQRSLRMLGGRYYPREVLEAALARTGTMDPRLIGDGTYLVAELEGRLAGSAGWTLRAPNYACLLREALPRLPGSSGTVRSVYVEPELARLGIARALVEAVEMRLALSGARMAELMATLSGVPFYASLGYSALSEHALPLAEGMEFVLHRMARPLPELREAA